MPSCSAFSCTSCSGSKKKFRFTKSPEKCCTKSSEKGGRSVVGWQGILYMCRTFWTRLFWKRFEGKSEAVIERCSLKWIFLKNRQSLWKIHVKELLFSDVASWRSATLLKMNTCKVFFKNFSKVISYFPAVISLSCRLYR